MSNKKISPPKINRIDKPKIVSTMGRGWIRCLRIMWLGISMPLGHEYLVPANINNISDLPIKAIVSSPDQKLLQRQIDLLKCHPRDFQLGDIREAATSDLQNCFIYITMFMDNNYSSCKNDLNEEIKIAKQKALPIIIFKVSSITNFPFLPIYIGILSLLIGILGFLCTPDKIHYPTRLVIILILVILVFVVLWYFRWFSLHRKCPLPETKNQDKNFQVKKTTMNNLVSDIYTAFKKRREYNTCVKLWGKLNNTTYRDFWNDEVQKLERRKQIASKNGYEPEEVWLVRHVLLLEDEDNPRILVLLPAKDLDKFKIRSKMKLGQETTPFFNQLYHTPKESVSYYISYYVSYTVDTASQVSWKSTRDGMTVVLRLSNKMGKRIAWLNRAPTGELFLMFVCYNYLQEEYLKKRLIGDLKKLEKEELKYRFKKSTSRKLSRTGNLSSKVSHEIKKSKIVIVLWGDKTRFSGNIKKEFELAQQRNKPIILLDGRSNPTPSDISLTGSYKYVQWDTEIDVKKVLLEVTERLLNENKL